MPFSALLESSEEYSQMNVAIDQVIMLQDHQALYDAVQRGGRKATEGHQLEAVLNPITAGVQIVPPQYAQDLREMLGAYRFLASARPSTRLETRLDAEGAQAQVSFWHEVEKGTIIYGIGRHPQLSMAIGQAMLQAENKAVILGVGLRDLQKGRPANLLKEALVATRRWLTGMSIAGTSDETERQRLFDLMEKALEENP